MMALGLLSSWGCQEVGGRPAEVPEPPECSHLETVPPSGVEDDVVTMPELPLLNSVLRTSISRAEGCLGEAESAGWMTFRFRRDGRNEEAQVRYNATLRMEEVGADCAITLVHPVATVQAEGADPSANSEIQFCDQLLFSTAPRSAAEAIDVRIHGLGVASRSTSWELAWLPIAGLIEWNRPWNVGSCDGPTLSLDGVPGTMQTLLRVSMADWRRVAALGDVTFLQVVRATGPGG